jgi:hypothetical protein
MRNPGPRKVCILASIFLATMFLVACEQSNSPAPSTAAAPQSAAPERVFIIFDGPWAFAPDPKDAASVLAIAPKTKGHRDLYVKASNESTLAAGTYDLSFPTHSGSAAATADPNIAQAKIDSKNLQHALDEKSARYVIRLPKPEEYVVSSRSRSRFGATYPPGPSTEKDYASAVSLRYNVSTLNGFSLSGTPDSGAFNPLLLQVEVPMIRFVIVPTQFDDPKDKCDTHSRESFHDLTSLLGLTLYVDYPDNPADCHSKDPQTARPAKAENEELPPFEPLGEFPAGRSAQVKFATGENLLAALRFLPRSRGHRGSIDYLATAIYFFGMSGADCHAPELILTPTP